MENKFDPNDICVPNGNYFALPYSVEESGLVIISAPWDVTTSYRDGAALAPDSILDASLQVDLYDYDFGKNYEKGIATHPFDEDLLEMSKKARLSAEKVISRLEMGIAPTEWSIAKALEHTNEASRQMNKAIYDTAKEHLDNGKKVALVGGDHSTPLGLIKAVAEKHGEMGLLHIDAHADLREAYEGFTYSHASIMYNVLKEVGGISQLTQVGIRDFCEEENDLIQNNKKITTFFDRAIQNKKFEGATWKEICDQIIDTLPQKVYISMDIDGLRPYYCLNTGTPVPGGLTYNELVYLLVSIVKKGKEVVGFDLTEVVGHKPDSIDANIGARLLYKLSLLTLEK